MKMDSTVTWPVTNTRNLSLAKNVDNIYIMFVIKTITLRAKKHNYLVLLSFTVISWQLLDIRRHKTISPEINGLRRSYEYVINLLVLGKGYGV